MGADNHRTQRRPGPERTAPVAPKTGALGQVRTCRVHRRVLWLKEGPASTKTRRRVRAQDAEGRGGRTGVEPVGSWWHTTPKQCPNRTAHSRSAPGVSEGQGQGQGQSGGRRDTCHRTAVDDPTTDTTAVRVLPGSPRSRHPLKFNPGLHHERRLRLGGSTCPGDRHADPCGPQQDGNVPVARLGTNLPRERGGSGRVPRTTRPPNSPTFLTLGTNTLYNFGWGWGGHGRKTGR